MKVVYHMAKSDIPSHQFRGLTELLQSLEAPDFQYSANMYHHNESLNDMEVAIEKTLIEELDEKLKQSEFLGLIIDETVNITVDKKLIVYLKFENSGKAETIFLGNYTIQSGTAQSIYSNVVDALKERGLDVGRVMGLGSDGASVMMGAHAGVGALLKKESVFAVQREDVNLGCISPMVQASVAALTHLRHTPGPEEQSFYREYVNGKFKDVAVTEGTEKHVRTFNNTRRQYIEELIEALERRFPHDDLNILKGFDLIFNPDRYPVSCAKPLMEHYGTPKETDGSTVEPLISCENAQQDVVPLLTALRGYGGLNFLTACETVIRELGDIFPDWAKLAKIACTIQV
ncbi:hypothetical protein ACEWY4_020568 [Coilia grayii]|uniref:DUF4371 domain-containing protein n=1 Tax=Coilia grayii TaxID=363190 RepID=A0ABD1JFA5_9TELE